VRKHEEVVPCAIMVKPRCRVKSSNEWIGNENESEPIHPGEDVFPEQDAVVDMVDRVGKCAASVVLPHQVALEPGLLGDRQVANPCATIDNDESLRCPSSRRAALRAGDYGRFGEEAEMIGLCNVDTLGWGRDRLGLSAEGY
jgi:hypothetical protein